MQQGDTVTVTAYGLYPQAQQHGFFFSLASFLANLLHPASPPPPGLDGRRRTGLPLLQVGVAAGLASVPQLSGGVPQGYLRLLVFNKDSALVGQQVQQLSQAAKGSYEPLRLQVVLPQDGYVTAYVGSQSDVDVFFDDVTVEHRPGLQVQETQYDPAGLELAGLAAPSPGIRGLNNYRFNGKEFQTDLGLAWNHQDWRFFDPQILRWHVGDPEIENGQESWTPYSFGYDNAVRYADANGRAPGEGPGLPNDFVARAFFGFGISVFNLGAQAVATVSGTSYKYEASFTENIDTGEATGTQIQKVPRAGALEEAKTAGSDVLNVGVTLYGGKGAGKFFEQASGKVAAAEVVQEGQALAKGAGRLGKASTRAQNDKIATSLEADGYTVTNGAGRGKEEYLKPIGGGRKGGSYPDITANKAGKTIRVNTVDANKGGKMTTREANNAVRIGNQKPNDALFLIPK